MSKKNTHGHIPRGNQPKHGIDPQKLMPEEEDQDLADEVEGQSAIPVDDIVDEKGRIRPPTAPEKQH